MHASHRCLDLSCSVDDSCPADQISVLRTGAEQALGVAEEPEEAAVQPGQDIARPDTSGAQAQEGPLPTGETNSAALSQVSLYDEACVQAGA